MPLRHVSYFIWRHLSPWRWTFCFLSFLTFHALSSDRHLEDVSSTTHNKLSSYFSFIIIVIWYTHHHHQSHNCEGRLGTTDNFATSFLHFALFSTALWDLANSRPVHSLMLSSHLFFCLPCLLPPFTVPCNMGFLPDLTHGKHVISTSICVCLRNNNIMYLNIWNHVSAYVRGSETNEWS